MFLFVSTEKLGKILVTLKVLIPNRKLSEGTYSGKILSPLRAPKLAPN